MKKNIYVVLLFVLVVGFCSCQTMDRENIYQAPDLEFSSKYGSYLAGRVAHVRKDFNTAADYYAKTVEIDKENVELISQLYIIYASSGDLANASKYAKKLQEMGDDNSFLETIIAVDEIKAQNYKKVIETLSSSNVPIYKDFINPLILAWAYAGDDNLDMAIKQLQGFKTQPSLKALYSFQAAMIYDYFGKTKQAEDFYNVMASDYKTQLSFRALQLMSNFYLRNGQQQKAIELVNIYKDDALFAPMLNSLLASIKKNKDAPAPIIVEPSLGLAESLFSIAATLRTEGQNVDLAHIFVSMSIYSNPNYDLAKLLLADILENREMFLEANDVYNTIGKNSDAYYIVLRKKASNYAALKEFYNAQKMYEEVIANNPDDVEAHLALGEALREQDSYGAAIEYYNKGIEKIKKVGPEHWVLYYYLGVGYEKTQQWQKGEKALLTALELSSHHFLVQNYLGYVWLENNQNIDKAFALIVEAYRQAPNDGNVADSLGYAFYKLGFYNKAITYLEEAVLLEPNNPIIFEHLGDAYYMAGRKNEAGFQWNHALFLKDGGEPDFEPEKVEKKIKNGVAHAPLKIEDKNFVEDKIKELEG